MKRILFLPVLVSLLRAECPPIMQGFNASEEITPSPVNYLPEVKATVCGERNFTSAFWHPVFFQNQLINIFVCEKFEKLYDNCDQFKPLFKSLNQQFDLMENEVAKGYIKDFRAVQRKSWSGEIDVQKMFGAIFSMIAFNFGHTLPVDGERAMSQAFKKAFQYQESAEIRRSRVHTAMKAIERVGPLDAKLGELFAKTYLLMKDNYIFGAQFLRYAEWAEKKWNSSHIGPLEVLPAAEILYIQYISLNNTEAKAIVELTVASLGMASMTDKGHDIPQPLPDILDELTKKINSTEADFEKTCPSGNIVSCYQDLDDDAKVALSTTFPELFDYFSNNADPSRWTIDAQGGQIYRQLKSEIEAAARAHEIRENMAALGGDGRRPGTSSVYGQTILTPYYPPTIHSFLPSHSTPFGSLPVHSLPINSFSSRSISFGSVPTQSLSFGSFPSHSIPIHPFSLQ